MLILEDDIEFKEGFDLLLENALKELPENWDALWMGGTSNKMQDYKYSKVLKRLLSGTGGYCILMRETMYDACIELLSTETYQADILYSHLMPKFQVFRTVGNYIKHKPGMSTIQKIYVNHAALAK